MSPLSFLSLPPAFLKESLAKNFPRNFVSPSPPGVWERVPHPCTKDRFPKFLTQKPPHKGSCLLSVIYCPPTQVIRPPTGDRGESGDMDLGRAGTARTSPSAPRGPPARFWFLLSCNKRNPPAGETSFLVRKEAKNFCGKLALSFSPPGNKTKFQQTARKKIPGFRTMKSGAQTEENPP